MFESPLQNIYIFYIVWSIFAAVRSVPKI